MMDEDLALYTSLSCCMLSSVSGNPWLWFICEDEGQRSTLGGSVLMGSHWKSLVKVRMRARGEGWPSCYGFLKSQDAGALFILGTNNNPCYFCPPRQRISLEKSSSQSSSHFLRSLPLLSPLFSSFSFFSVASENKAWLQVILSAEVGRRVEYHSPFCIQI